MKIRTALVRTKSGALTVELYEDDRTNKEFVDDLRADGFEVLKIWIHCETALRNPQIANLKRRGKPGGVNPSRF